MHLGVGVNIKPGHHHLSLYGYGAPIPYDRPVIQILLYQALILPDRSPLEDHFVHQARVPAVVSEAARQLHLCVGA